MGRRRQLQQHRQSLSEIRDIMNSMKTLAYMETHKLVRTLGAQAAVVDAIEQVAVDLLVHYHLSPPLPQGRHVYLVVGSERGFCGDFNHALQATLTLMIQQRSDPAPPIIAMGRKLYTLLESDYPQRIALDGASMSEESEGVLNSVTQTLLQLQQQYPDLILWALFHDGNGEVVSKALLPPFHDLQQRTLPLEAGVPPLLNMTPEQLFSDIAEHYLLALLQQMLLTSLYAENHKRVAHMEGAVKHLDEESLQLSHRYNALRQEEITEEIEVILLNAANLEGCGVEPICRE